MSRYIKGESREQVNILPICLDKIISENYIINDSNNYILL